MINLRDFKNKSFLTRQLPREDSSLYPLQIGFKVESKFSILRRILRKKLHYFVEELRVTGFHKDVSMWNLIFLNVFFAVAMYYIVSVYFINLPAEVGVNIDMDTNYDFLVYKGWLYFPSFLHSILAICVLIINLKAYRKLSHLMVTFFFYCIVLMYFELIGFISLVRYFL